MSAKGQKRKSDYWRPCDHMHALASTPVEPTDSNLNSLTTWSWHLPDTAPASI